MVERPLCMRKVRGSIPLTSILFGAMITRQDTRTTDRSMDYGIHAFLGKSLGAHVEAGCHSMVGDFDLISSQDAKILHA